MEKRVGVVNRKASFGGGQQFSRSIESRILAPLSILEGKNEIQFDVFDENIFGSSTFDRYNISAIFFCRHVSRESLNLHVECKKKGIKTIYDVDDLITEYPPYFSIDQEKKVELERALKHLNLADVITVENETLREHLPSEFHDKMIVLPNSFDFDSYPLRKKRGLRSKNLLFTNAAGLKIDRFRADFFSAVNAFCNEFEYSIHVFSDLPESLFPIERLVYRGPTSWAEHKKIISGEVFDFALIPLGGGEDAQSRKFNSCKSLIKYIEYSACDIPGIYSDVLPYKSRLHNGYNAILADNSKNAWIESMKMFLDDQRRSFISENSFHDVIENFSMTSMSDILKEIIHR